MDAAFNADLPAFLDFCKSLDAAVVQTPEKALELYRARERENGASESAPNDLGRDLRQLREQIIASGALLLNENELDRERAARRGDKPSAE